MEVVFQKVTAGRGRPSKFIQMDDGTLVPWKQFAQEHPDIEISTPEVVKGNGVSKPVAKTPAKTVDKPAEQPDADSASDDETEPAEPAEPAEPVKPAAEINVASTADFSERNAAILKAFAANNGAPISAKTLAGTDISIIRPLNPELGEYIVAVKNRTFRTQINVANIAF